MLPSDVDGFEPGDEVQIETGVPAVKQIGFYGGRRADGRLILFLEDKSGVLGRYIFSVSPIAIAAIGLRRPE